jgi:hypothetical protein
MNNPRTWNRREFAVTPNGLFSILKPTGWFPTVRLPGGFRYRVGLSEENGFPHVHENPSENPKVVFPSESTFVSVRKDLAHADSQETAILSQTMQLSTHDYSLMRTALIVLVATAITLSVLYWLLDYITGFSIY